MVFPPFSFPLHRPFLKRFQACLSAALMIVMFVAPLAIRTSAQTNAAGVTKLRQADHFVFYRGPNGEFSCREATPFEARELDRITPLGLQQITDQGQEANLKGENATAENVDHLTIILRATAQLNEPQNAAAKQAFLRAAQLWEAQIKSPITVYIDVDFGTTNFGQPWGGGIIGSTSAPTITSLYSTVRNQLIAGFSKSSEPPLYNSLPSSSLPTNQGAATSIIVAQTIARAIGLLPATAPDPGTGDTTARPRIAFNSNFDYDFNPNDGSDGPGGDGIDPGSTDFEAVAVHEIGHALGFTSRAGRTTATNPAIWDIFRFRTGTTLATFGPAQRIMTADGLQFYFSGPPQVGLSTGGADGDAPGGDGNQSSHWKDDVQTGGIYIGIMDPTISRGVRRQMTSNDTIALDSFGYNLSNSIPPPPPPPPPATPANDDFANAQILSVSGCSGSAVGTNIGATKQPGEQSHDPNGDAGGGSVWYQWQAPTNGSVTITTEGSTYDTLLAVYTGTSVGGLTAIAKNDDVVLGDIIHSELAFSATAGTIYKIAVDGWGGDSGNIVLNWFQGACTNAMTAQFSAGSYPVSEGAGSVQIRINRSNTSQAATVTYATSDTAGLTSCGVVNGAASERCDYQTTVGTARFAVGEASKTVSIPIIDDAHNEGNESFVVSLKASTGALLTSPLTAIVTIQDNATPTVNPIETPSFFITQQYIDFLGRLPDSGGFANWMATLTGCPNGGFGEFDNPDCDRVHVSAGFYLSEEFRGRGYWAYRFYEVAFNRRPNYAEFVPDMAQVGGAQSPESEVLSKNQYQADFVQRSEFTNRYNGLTNAAFVNTIETNAEVDLDNTALTNQLNGGKSRAQLLREIVESKLIEDRFFIRAFVAMQYFGYLRRDPDTVGYNNWVTTLTANPSDFRHMIFGFIYSPEYRARFGNN